MAKYIDADKLKRHYAWWDDESKKIFDEIIDLQPAADVQPERRGRWEAIDRDCRGYAITYECSSCKQLITLPYPMKWMDYDYCPNCGAKMEE